MSTGYVRQGGILSLIYFNVFVDDLSRELSHNNVGCSVNQSLINHLFYADHTVLLAPSPAALQILLDNCQRYAVANGILFNSNKTVCMVILPECLGKLNVPTMFFKW